jgi:dCMP deaminase
MRYQVIKERYEGYEGWVRPYVALNAIKKTNAKQEIAEEKGTTRKISMTKWIEEMKKGGHFNPWFLDKLLNSYRDPPLTQRAYHKLEHWAETAKHVPTNRPSWADTHMAVAYVYAKRSHDAQTKHGCVIVDENNRPVGLGYNGVMAGVDEKLLPNIRNDKYAWMLHSELNAIFNCQHRPINCTAIVTGHPCLHCFMSMCQVGIKEIIYDCRPERNAVMLDDDMMALLEVAQFLTQNKIKMTPYHYEGATE